MSFFPSICFSPFFYTVLCTGPDREHRGAGASNGEARRLCNGDARSGAYGTRRDVGGGRNCTTGGGPSCADSVGAAVFGVWPVVVPSVLAGAALLSLRGGARAG